MEQKSALHFELKLQAPLTGALNVGMRCGDLNGAPCHGVVDVKPLVKAEQNWQNISIVAFANSKASTFRASPKVSAWKVLAKPTLNSAKSN
ncbi:MAG: putative glycoside hydrolase [Rheinheimera sp.]|nr:putative glycoside hydrolase [Rheinheimera sp.]